MSAAIELPELSLVVLIGASGSGKSTFAKRLFAESEVVSSDACRRLVSDNENDQSVTGDAFDLLHTIIAKRLKNRKLTVVDATNLRPEDRQHYVRLAREYHCLPVAIVLNIPERICRERTAQRTDRDFGGNVVARQCQQLRRSLRGLKREGFRQIVMLDDPAAVDAARIARLRMWTDRRHERGPFDIIGDVHGCFSELTTLLSELGYERSAESKNGQLVMHPLGRRVVFLGDLVDRGPNTPDVLRLAMNMVEAGMAMWVPGNHDVKLMRKLQGKDVRITHGLAESLAQLQKQPSEFSTRVARFIDGLISHFVLDGGRLVVAHAGMKENMHGRASAKVRDFALYGETTGETDEFGLPIRYPWAEEYRGRALVVYGHTPVSEPEWLNNTVNIDTGCVFGGQLSALRYPEKDIVSVRAESTYYEPVKPFLPEEQRAPVLTPQQVHDDVLDVADVTGKRIIRTPVATVPIREGNAAAALEVMTRFAVDPKWLIYLPPTMSPIETTTRDGYLEYPTEAFSYYRTRGVPAVVCEEKHMGSRAVLVVCRGVETARARFGVTDGRAGICYTRTGRPFFGDATVEAALLASVRNTIDCAGLWESLATDWICLDAELMPWSAKAQELIRQQYAAVGASASAAMLPTLRTLEDAAHNGRPVEWVLDRFRQRSSTSSQFTDAYRRYCWPVRSITDLKLAPFHLMASEGQVHVDQDHRWHMEQLHRLCDHGDGLLVPTTYRVVDIADQASQVAATEWWENLTNVGGEGMVVKPVDFIPHGRRGSVQPAVKCRGREYLRIIYGPDYTMPEHLDRLRRRGLGTKRTLAMQEFALGIEALERFVRREPLRRVHECVFGVLALESEPVDPRL